MRSIGRRDTAPERLVRSELHRRGFRFRVDYPVAVESGRAPRPDIAFTRKRVAVFIDGCFWHGCHHHSKPAKRNSGYWGPKIARNIERDRENDSRLHESGWAVIRIWEHDDVAGSIHRIEALLAK